METTGATDSLHAWAQLTRAQQLLARRIEAGLKANRLPPLVWYDVLLELSRAERGCLRHRDLHQKMLLEKYNLSRLLDRMEENGLVTRNPSPDDARGSDIAITDSGRALRQRIWPVYRDIVTDYFAARISANDITTLNGILARLKES